MTISSTTRVAGPFIGNGTATVFPFTFKVFAAADLDVIRLNSSTGVETTLVLNSDYTVTLNGNQNTNPGGSVTLSAGALATGLTLTITSDIANLQPTDLTNQGGFYPEVITDSFDRATIQIQQMADDLTRSIKTPISDGLSLNMELPTASQRANSFLAFDASGEPTVVTAGSSGAPATITRQTFSGTGSQTVFTLASDPGALGNSAQVYIAGVYQQRSTYTISGTTLTFSQAPVAGTDNIEFINFLTSSIGATSADLVTYTPAGAGAVARSAASKFGDTVSVKDFGAVGDGVADDTVAIQAAVNYALQNETNLDFSSGSTYRITAEINFPKYHTGVIRKWIGFDGCGSTIIVDGSFTAFGYTKPSGSPLLDAANYFLIFNNFHFKSTSNNGAIAIRAGGFVTSKYINLYFEDIDYPFWQENSDPRGTNNYVQGSQVIECYAYNVKTFWTATRVYDVIFVGTMVDVGTNGIAINFGPSGQSGFDCSITNCIFQSLSGIALHIGGIQGLAVSDNYFENNGREYVAIHSTTVSDGGVYWTYQYAETAWSTSASIANTGIYRVNAGKIYVSKTIGITGATAPTHTAGTVSDGGVDWEYVGAYSAWASSQTISAINEYRSNASKLYASQTTGTTGASAPTHTTGTVFNYGGIIEGNFVQPKSPAITGRKAAFDLGENQSNGMRLGGNVAQDQNIFAFSQYANGFWDAIGDRSAITAATLYSPSDRPNNVKAIFADGFRWGLLWGQDGGMVFNLQSRGIEFTNVAYDYLDPITNRRVPIVCGVAVVAPPGFGPTGAFPPGTYPSLYPQKPWARGSYLSNPQPSVLGTLGSQYVILGWSCTVSGTPGTWVECRTLTGT